MRTWLAHHAQLITIWLRSDCIRYTVRNSQTSEEDTIHLSKEQEADQSHFVTADGAELEARQTSIFRLFFF